MIVQIKLLVVVVVVFTKKKYRVTPGSRIHALTYTARANSRVSRSRTAQLPVVQARAAHISR